MLALEITLTPKQHFNSLKTDLKVFSVFYKSYHFIWKKKLIA